MLVDARKIEHETTIDCDLCIVGAGAAGITIANEFEKTSSKICLMESGGFHFDAKIQSLYDGENIGLHYFPLSACRLRYFGGATNHWGGWCSPLDPIDFTKRDYVDESGWPISFIDLEEYYKRAQDIISDPPYKLENPEYWTNEDHKLLPFSPDFQTKIFEKKPLNFGTKYKKSIVDSNNVHLFIHANLVDIDANEEKSEVKKFGFKSLTDNSFYVKSKYYIIACGGLENPRILLLNSRDGKAIGNRYDLVGKYYMEHPHAPVGSLTVTSDFPMKLYSWSDVNGKKVAGEIITSDDFQLKNRLLNTSFRLQFPLDQQLGDNIMRKPIWSLTDLVNRKSLTLDEQVKKDLQSIIKDFDSLILEVNDKFLNKPSVSLADNYMLYSRTEQAPDANSKVILSNKLDKLGQNEIDLNWTLTKQDKIDTRKSFLSLAAEIGRMKLGRVKVFDWLMADDTSWPPELRGGPHHMGTTRMSDDARKGVVDKNCKVHGVSNLYIGGSSVFPTSGAANPTFTIVAMSVRLADYLKNKMV